MISVTESSAGLHNGILVLCIAAVLCGSGCVTAVTPPDENRALHRLRHPDGSELLELRGQIHVHTRYSHDSSGKLRHVWEAAKETGCDFVIITDHDRYGALPYRGFIEDRGRKLLLLVGIEYSSREGHLLDLFPSSFYDPKMPPQELLDLINSGGGFAVVAHPEGKRRWKNWDLEGIGGVEVYNTAVDMGEEGPRLLGRTLRSLLGRMDSLLSSVNRPSGTIGLWEYLERRGQALVAIGASNAHGRRIGGSFNWDSYDNSFSVQSNRVWVRSFDRDGIREAIRAGRLYQAFDGLEDTAGFSFRYRTDSREWIMGQRVPVDHAGGELRVESPSSARISLYRDGELQLSLDGVELVLPEAGPGVWRVELKIRDRKFGEWRPWIISNPIRIGGSDEPWKPGA